MIPSSLAFLLVLANLGAQPTWEIPGVDVRLAVQTDRSIRVTEIIHVNSGPHARRGIDRELPTVVQHPLVGPLELEIEMRGVTRDGGHPVPFTVERGPHSLWVRLGQPDTTRTGETIYRLEYVIDGGIVVGMNRETMAWPVVNGEWNAAIFQVEAIVELPETMDASEVFAGSWTGFFGQQGRAADVQIADPRRLVYRQLRGLKAHERLGIYATWPRLTTAAGDGRTGGGRLPPPLLLAVILLAAVLVFIYLRRRAIQAG